MNIYPLPRIVLSCFVFVFFPLVLSAQLTVTITATNVSCFGAADGQAKANPGGGVSPYTYKWSNNSTAQSIQNLMPDLYQVTVTDASQSTKTASVNLLQPSPLGLNVFGQSQICEVSPDGMAACVPFGGTPPYSYLWSNGSNTAQISNLVGGTYTVTATDAKGCTATNFFEVGFWDEGIWLMSSSSPAQCAYKNGLAHVSTGSGTEPFQYLWSNGETSSTVDSLDPGIYLVTVSDANGCSNTAAITVPYDNAWLSFQVQVPIPFCLNTLANFQEPPAPPIYPVRLWTLSDTADQIISGQGTDSIQVQWASTGPKTVKYQFGANGIFCSSTTYSLNVAVCAAANEPALNGVNVTPNPFSEIIQLGFPEFMPINGKAILTDLSGKPILAADLNAQHSILQTTQIPAGCYFLKLQTDKGERVLKMIKN